MRTKKRMTVRQIKKVLKEEMWDSMQRSALAIHPTTEEKVRDPFDLGYLNGYYEALWILNNELFEPKENEDES